MDSEVNAMQSIEKNAVENFLGEEAQEVSRQSIADGLLTVWRNVRSLPSRRACTYTLREGGVCVPNSGDDQFYALLTRAIAGGVDLASLCEVIPLASPVPRRLVATLLPYLSYLADSWHAPKLEQGQFVCFVENLASGRVERLAIDASSHEVVDVGEGLRFGLR